MLQQFYVPYESNKLYVMSWLNESAKGNVMICPPVLDRSLSGIRYYVSQMAMKLYKEGYSVFVPNYLYTGNSGIGSHKLTLNYMTRSVETVIEFLNEEIGVSFDVIIGVAAGNFIAAGIANRKEIQQVILMNPDFKAASEMVCFVNCGCKTQRTCLVDGCYTTYYYAMVDNGSDASFTVMNIENPDVELKFWDSFCGPFFGGEEESVSSVLVEELSKEDLFADLRANSNTSIIYWGKRNDMNAYRMHVKEVIFSGDFTNENYWCQSSILFDKTMDDVVNLVCNVEREVKKYNYEATLSNLAKCSSLYNKRECISVDYKGLQCLGMLHSPIAPSDKKYPLILFEHGLGCDSIGEFGSWAKLTEKLSCLGFYCYRYDHLGSGVSEGDFEDTLYTDYVGQLLNNIENLQKREELKDRKIVIVSWSFGAYISLITAEQLKEKVLGYVLWSPLLIEGTATTKVKFYRSKKGGYRFPISPLWLSIDYLKEEKKYDYDELYSKVEKPLLLITGEMDNKEFYKLIEEDIKLKKNPDRKHIMVSYTGHCYSKETIDYVIHCTISWLHNLCKD